MDGVEYDSVSEDDLALYLSELAEEMPIEPPSEPKLTESGMKVSPLLLPDSLEEAELPVEEIARRYRGVAFTWDGKILIEKELPLELARTIKAQKSESIRVEGDPGSQVAAHLPQSEVQGRGIFGTDDRKIPSDAAVAASLQLRTIVHLITADGGTSIPCSGVAVGARTILTAAHCVSPWGRMPWQIVMTPAAKGQENYPAVPKGPYGSFHMTSSRCSVHVPAGYLADINRADNFYDYAAIVCADKPSPIQKTGWNGYWVNPPQGNQTMAMHGYPGSAKSGTNHQHCPGVTTWPYLCGMSGTGDIWDSRVESSKIDSGSGQSGGPWRRADGYVIGTNVGYYEYGDLGHCGLFTSCKRSTGRLLDTAYYNFVKGKSPDWN